MKRIKSIGIGFTAAAICAMVAGSFAADAPAKVTPPLTAQASNNPSMVPPAAPGVFSMQKKGVNGFHLIVVGHTFTARTDIEKYLAWRAADLTLQMHGTWFTFSQIRSKGDKVPVPKRDPEGMRYSFRMANFQPVWRYKSDSPVWQSWSPFSGAPFFADGKDPKKITDFEVSADIVVHKGQMDDADPLSFDAGAVSDLLINQVSPPT